MDTDILAIVEAKITTLIHIDQDQGLNQDLGLDLVLEVIIETMNTSESHMIIKITMEVIMVEEEVLGEGMIDIIIVIINSQQLV